MPCNSKFISAATDRSRILRVVPKKYASHQPCFLKHNPRHIHRQDDRRIEVMANGLPVCGGSELYHHSLPPPGTGNHGAGPGNTQEQHCVKPDRRLGIETGGRWPLRTQKLDNTTPPPPALRGTSTHQAQDRLTSVSVSK